MIRPDPLALVGLFGTACLVATACTSSEGADPAFSPEPADTVRWHTRGGDVFAPTVSVVGSSPCGDVTLEVNEQPVAPPLRMTGSKFEGEVALRPGENAVVARCKDADEASEPLILNSRVSEDPIARIDVAVDGETVLLDGRKSEGRGAAVTSYEWTIDPRHPSRLLTAAGKGFKRSTGPRLELRAPDRDGDYYVSLDVSDEHGRSDKSTTYFVVEEGRARTVDMMHEHPSWIDQAVVYAPIPQLWGNGGPKTVERRLPYLKGLGVDVLWLWPPSSLRAFGEEYAIMDYFQVDPSWGPERALKRMVDEAHRLGMHVIIDFVPNHMSIKSPFFQDGKKHGEDSPYYDYFDRNGRGKPTHYFDWPHLPNLNFENPEVRTMVTEASAHWVRDIGIDGFRMDVAWGVKRRAPDYWPKWRREMKRINPDLLLLAEASAVDPYYFSHGFDVAYDWTKNLGDWAWGSSFEFPQESGTLLEIALTNGGKGYSTDAVILRFLNNNDTGVRFVDQHGPELTRVAAVLQFTVPGIPAMFAGDEVGASYEPYSNLTPISWRDRFGLRPLYKRLIDLRHEVPALTSSRMDILSTSSSSVLAFVRPAVDTGGPVLVALNFGSKGRVEIEGAPALEELLVRSGGETRDLLTNAPTTLAATGGSVTIPMKALSAVVLAPEGG